MFFIRGNLDFMADNVPYIRASIRTILAYPKSLMCDIFFYFLPISNAIVEQNVDSGIY